MCSLLIMSTIELVLPAGIVTKNKGYQREMDKAKKSGIMEQYARSKGDTGSSEVQIAVLTEKIKEMTEHLRYHKKDNHSRKGLLAMVSRRKKLLRYLNTKNIESYRSIVKELKIRH